MYYSDDIVEEVRSANNIVDVIGTYVHLTKKGSSYFGLCPFHNEKTGSFSVSESKQMYYCFGCGAGGNVFTFLREYEHMNFGESMNYLAERAGIRLPEQEMSPQEKKARSHKQEILEVNREAARYYYAVLMSEHGKIGRAYLKKRELSDETVKKFGLGFSEKYSDSLYRYLKAKGYQDELLRDTGLFMVNEKEGMIDKFWNRIMFPILDVNQKVIAFGGRVMGDAKPKYLNSPETEIFDKSRNLYGLYLARRARSHKFILCEGYMDVIALHQAGFSTAVASLGTSFTEGQAKLLERYADSIYLVYDSDNAGVKAILRALPILKKHGLDALVVHLDPYKDPDEFIKELGKEAFQERLDQAENGFLFKIGVLEKEYDLARPEEKTKFMHAVAGNLLDFTDPIERDAYTESIARRYGVRTDYMKELVAKEAMKGTIIKTVDYTETRMKKKEKDGSLREAERMLLTWITERPELFKIISRYVFPEDYSDGVLRTTAEAVYRQMQEKGSVMPASILNLFSDTEEQKEAAAVFSVPLGQLEEREFLRAVKEAIKKVKKSSLEKMSEELAPNDMAGFQKIIKTRKALENLDKLEMSR